MKKYILFFFGAMLYLNIAAQNISVASFKLLENDLTANTTGTKEIDQNGEAATLIKVVTAQTGFSFEGGSMGIVKTRQTPGEVWVYVPHGSKKITIKHPQLGVLRDYYYPMSIESARTYEMVLSTGVVQTIVKQFANSQYLILKVTPSDAVIELDNEILPNTNGMAQKFVKLGTYEYRVQALNYHTSAGKVTVDDPNNKKVLEVNLLPAYGWIEVLGNEDTNGAQVFIDNAFAGTIPMKSNNLSSGEHHVRIVKSLFNPYSQTVKVSDNEMTSITPLLKADYSMVTIYVDNDADIYVNEEKKGTGSWTGKLGSGTYVMEAKKEGHRSTLTNVDILAEQKSQTIQLSSPIPIYGSLNITSTPSEANVYIDDKYVGQTPLLIPNVLSKTHNITLSHKGYDDYKSIINISENEMASLNAVLTDENLVKVDLKCNVPQATLYVDGMEYGRVPDEIHLSEGSHIINLSADGYEKYEKTIAIQSTSFALKNQFEIVMQPLRVTIFCDLPNTYISIDNNNYNYCDYNVGAKYKLSKGIHTIAVKHEKKEFKVSINVSKGNEIFLFSSAKKEVFSPDIDKEEFEKQKTRIEKELIESEKKIEQKKQKESWDKIQLTSNSASVAGMTNVGDVTQKYNNLSMFDSVNENNRQRCIKRMKKAAAKLGASKILLGKPYQGGLFNSFCIIPGTAYK